MVAIYEIKNIINNKRYIGGSTNVIRRFRQHKSFLKKGNHPNHLLQQDYNTYGGHVFEYNTISILTGLNITSPNLRKIEEVIIKSTDRELLYNIQLNTNGAGADALKKPSYLLDLKGNILREYECTNDIYKELYKREVAGSYINLNTDMIIQKKYRIVTKEYYDNNLNTIKEWRPFSRYDLVLRDYRKYCRQLVLSCQETGTKSVYGSYSDIAKLFNVHPERMRQIRRNRELFRGNYTIDILNKPSNFPLYKYIKVEDR